MDVNREHPDMPNLLLTGDQTQGRFALVETVARHTDETPLHSHSQEDEFIYVLKGDVTFYVDGIRLERTAGSCVLLPKGSEHSYSIESEEARLLVLLMPAGLEGYYQELDEFAGADQDIDRLITVSARYGVYITGPGPPGSLAEGPSPSITHKVTAHPARRSTPGSSTGADEHTCMTPMRVTGAER